MYTCRPIRECFMLPCGVKNDNNNNDNNNNREGYFNDVLVLPCDTGRHEFWFFFARFRRKKCDNDVLEQRCDFPRTLFVFLSVSLQTFFCKKTVITKKSESSERLVVAFRNVVSASLPTENDHRPQVRIRIRSNLL